MPGSIPDTRPARHTTCSTYLLETNPDGSCRYGAHFRDEQGQLRDPASLVPGLGVQVAAQDLNSGLPHSMESW